MASIMRRASPSSGSVALPGRLSAATTAAATTAPPSGSAAAFGRAFQSQAAEPASKGATTTLYRGPTDQPALQFVIPACTRSIAAAMTSATAPAPRGPLLVATAAPATPRRRNGEN